MLLLLQTALEHWMPAKESGTNKKKLMQIFKWKRNKNPVIW